MGCIDTLNLTVGKFLYSYHLVHSNNLLFYLLLFLFMKSILSALVCKSALLCLVPPLKELRLKELLLSRSYRSTKHVCIPPSTLISSHKKSFLQSVGSIAFHLIRSIIFNTCRKIRVFSLSRLRFLSSSKRENTDAVCWRVFPYVYFLFG